MLGSTWIEVRSGAREVRTVTAADLVEMDPVNAGGNSDKCAIDAHSGNAWAERERSKPDARRRPHLGDRGANLARAG
jgi:hypothetical protein